MGAIAGGLIFSDMHAGLHARCDCRQEVFRKCGTEIHVSVGTPISVEEQVAHGASPEELGLFLRERTYELKKLK